MANDVAKVELKKPEAAKVERIDAPPSNELAKLSERVSQLEAKYCRVRTGIPPELYSAREELLKLRRRAELADADHELLLAKKHAEMMSLKESEALAKLSRHNMRVATYDEYGEPMTREEWSNYEKGK